MSISQNFPVADPALLLDFANTKSLDPRVTFTRASTGTYYDEDTNAMAEQNLQRYSEEFDTVGWSKSDSAIIPNDFVAPDGTTTADRMLGNAVNGVHYIANAGLLFSIPANTTGTFSIYVNKGTRRYVQIGIDNGSAGAYANFDLDIGTVTATGTYGATGTYIASAITNVGNGWFRISVTSSNSAGMLRVALVFIDNGTAVWAQSYLSSASDYMYLWGAQVEMRSAPGGYIKTTTQPLTTYIPVLLTAQANQPRFQHDPITRESLGLLIEEQRSNLALASETFSASTGTTKVADAIVSPSGLLNASAFYETSTTSEHYVQDVSITPTIGVTYCWSIYVKQGVGGRQLRMRIAAGNVGEVIFNIDNQTFGAGGGVVSAAGYTPVGNGWYRVWVIWTAVSSASTVCRFQFTITAAAPVYTGNENAYMNLWGRQLEAGAFPTSYIPTVASTATRSADAANMTGTNFSQWYSINEGTIYSEFTGRTARVIVHVSDNSFANRLPQLAIGSANNYEAYIVAGGSVTAGLVPAGTHVFGTFAKMSFGYGANGCTAVVNSGAISTASSVTFPTIINRMDIGTFQNGNNNLNGTIKKIAYYSERLSNAQLQAITS